MAKSNILKDEIIMTIPKECLISLETAFETSYGKKIGEFMYNELNSPKLFYYMKKKIQNTNIILI